MPEFLLRYTRQETTKLVIEADSESAAREMFADMGEEAGRLVDSDIDHESVITCTELKPE